MKILYYTRT